MVFGTTIILPPCTTCDVIMTSSFLEILSVALLNHFIPTPCLHHLRLMASLYPPCATWLVAGDA